MGVEDVEEISVPSVKVQEVEDEDRVAVVLFANVVCVLE